MSLPKEPIIKKFFTNKVESSRNNWYEYLIRIARIFLSIDGEEYRRDIISEKFAEISKRNVNAERDASNFRDEFGAYGSFLGLFRVEKKNSSWIIRVSESAKRFLCVTNSNAAAFLRAQLSLFQYPNGMGAAISDTGAISVQGNVKADTLRELENNIRLNPFRLICRIIVALAEIKKKPLHTISLSYVLLLCMFNDERINQSYNPSLQLIAQVYDDYTRQDFILPENYEGILTNFKRNFHILEKTGLFIRDSKFGLMIAQTNYEVAYECIKTISEMDYHYAAFDDLYGDIDEEEVKSIISDNSWGRYYDAGVLSEKTLEKLGFEPADTLPDVYKESEETKGIVLGNEYERAAGVLKKHLDTKEETFLTERSDIEKTRDELMSRFAPDILRGFTDDVILDKIFYTKGDNSESLCYLIEMNSGCRMHFGSIAGGSAHKFGLFQRKEDGKWISGVSSKQKELTYDEALIQGKKIRDALVKGAEIIENATLETVEDYEKLDDTLRDEISSDTVYYNWVWFHKYFSILFPDKLSSFHQNEWQKHVLWALRIKPSEKMYARSGQIAMVQKAGGWWYRQLFDIFEDKFGGVKQFFRLGSSDGPKGYASEWKKNGIVAIGWPALGSLENYKNDESSLSKDDIAAKLQEVYYPTNASTASKKAGELIRFYGSNQDTVFVVANGEKVIGLVDNVGQYRFDDASEMCHVKPGTWHSPFSDDEKMPEKSEGLLTSCVQLKNEENLMFLYEKYYYGDEAEEDYTDDNEDVEKMKTCLEINRPARAMKLYPLNQIIYGAPGTGKTYSTVEYALGIIDNIKIEYFRASYKDRKANVARYKELVKEGRIVFTTFHQNYGYEEFIQGLRPDKNSDKMAFKTVDGVFKTIADRALNDPNETNNYVIIIDEINRANISKVFGELITLIEDDKRWGEINETSATLQSGDPFAVPNNLYIVGTMNSADKSISLIDAALRRRFDFIEQKPDSNLVPDGVLRKMFDSINNDLVSQLDSTDLLIGHSYFMNRGEGELADVLNNNIIPLLYEYFYDDRKKVATILKNAIDNSGAKLAISDEKVGRLKVMDKDE